MTLQSISGIHPPRDEHELKGYLHASVHSSTAYNSQDMKAT